MFGRRVGETGRGSPRVRGGLGGSVSPARRLFIFGVVWALVPVMIFTTAQPVQAQDSGQYGPSVDFDFEGKSRLPGGDYDCRVSSFVGPASNPGVTSSSRCNWSLLWEGIDGIGLIWSGDDASGEYCEAQVFNGSQKETSSSLEKGKYSDRVFSPITTDGDAATCRMSEVCYTAYQDKGMFGGVGVKDEDCIAVDLGEIPADESGTCKWGKVGRLEPTDVTQVYNAPGIQPNYFERQYTVTSDFTQEMRYYVIAKRKDGGPTPGSYVDGTSARTSWKNLVSSTFPTELAGAVLGGMTIGTYTPWVNLGKSTGYQDLNPNEDLEVIGFGVFKWTTSSNYNLATGGDGTGLNGRYGMNDPANCVFYWGPKLYNDPGSDRDEPQGDGPAPPGGSSGGPPPPGEDLPPTDDGACEFSILDPSSWLEGGMCAAVGLLGQLVSLLGRVAGTLGSILNAIIGLLDDLAALFIPDPSSWGMDALYENFSTRPPGSVVTELGSIVGQSASAFTSAGGGCNLIDGQGTMVPNLSCAQAASIPGMAGLRSLVIAGMWLFTGWGMFQIVAKAVGRDGED